MIEKMDMAQCETEEFLQDLANHPQTDHVLALAITSIGDLLNFEALGEQQRQRAFDNGLVEQKKSSRDGSQFHPQYALTAHGSK